MNTLFWFRRDLRLFSNEALIAALNNGAKNAIFFVCEKQWQQHDVAPIQLDLLKRRVAYIRENFEHLVILCFYTPNRSNNVSFV